MTSDESKLLMGKIGAAFDDVAFGGNTSNTITEWKISLTADLAAIVERDAKKTPGRKK